MWALKLPKNVKIFAWRFINDALPTQVNLMHRKFFAVATCSLCNCLRESSGHALFFCTRAQQVWSLSHVFSPDPLISRMNGFEIFSSIAVVHQNDVLAKILCLIGYVKVESLLFKKKKGVGSSPTHLSGSGLTPQAETNSQAWPNRAKEISCRAESMLGRA
ncbi:hypothetical protein F8388_017727 [Cannabis sativa]|uniref:Reverse transcriptase zinc-binding domain-containing protein n=1 Tax=Cannabis sativa TaxID=3483 RepID=A0A7J6HK63_CANSA|nr:hypothetical protein F8388_017727 [Cannabis sativa]